MGAIDALDIPLFASLTEEERHQVLRSMTALDLPPGEVLVREGEKGDCMYVITDGEIEFLKAMGTPEEHLLSVYSAGEFFGEVALLDSQGRRSASARARTPVSLLRLTAADFTSLMQAHPLLANQMAHLVSERLRKASDATIRDLEAKNQALAQAYQELKTAHDQIVEKERLEKELDVARQVQRSMLPESLPEVEGFSFGALMHPARQVGGDFYDLFPLDATHVGVVIGDVSDKGVPSALFMALTRSLLRAEALRLDTPEVTLRRVNALLQEMSTSGLFVTVLYGVLDVEKRQFAYARAGHELPILLRADGSVQAIPHATGMLMGLLSDIQIDNLTVDLSPGDALLLFSDGVTDAPNLEREMFGHERLAQALQAHHDCEAQQLCDKVFAAVNAYQKSVPQFDDITIVSICATHEKDIRE